MTLTATRHPVAPEVIVVSTDATEWAEGNVVARYNATHDILTRTHYAGTKPAMRDIRAAIAAV